MWWKRPFALVCVTFALLAGGFGLCQAAEDSASAPTNKAVTDGKVRQLLDLLSDPGVRQALEQQHGIAEAPAPEPPYSNAMATSLGSRLQGLRDHLGTLADSIHDVPSQAHMAHAMALDSLRERGITTTLALAAFVVLGFGAQGLFSLAGRPFRRWLIASKLDTVDERLRAVLARLLYALGLLASYAIGSIGAFLLFDWPEIIKAVLLGFLVAFLVVRLSTIVGRFLLAPGAERFRVVPISTEAAWFFYIRLVLAAILLSFGWQILVLLGRFGLSGPVGELGADALGFLLMALGIETLWRMPPIGESSAPSLGAAAPNRRHFALLGSAVLLVLWLLWLIQSFQLFWLTAFCCGLPLLIMITRASVAHILRPAGTVLADDEARSFQAVIFERGVRSLIIISAALLLARVFDIDIVTLTMRDTLGTRMLRGLISVVVIGLAAEFLWTLIKALIDRKLKKPLPHGASDMDAGHAARLLTLLPIVSNILLATIVIVAAMMMLAALGVQIGPLIASAGVVGVAIGFGAQTLVRDVISGIFYLVDDAFRIGEYIQSGNYKGTVESFSLRSVKLRHQRGALYTVPFGVLGAVQNQSRDWVVDKIVMNVPYGTDLEQVRKLIKRIGIELSEDPEFAPDIISPLKMQGVTQFGDFAIQIQTKMTTKPGDTQFMARRRALLLIKQAFEANNIGFAVPTVQVSGDNAGPAAAAQGMAMLAASKAAAE